MVRWLASIIIILTVSCTLSPVMKSEVEQKSLMHHQARLLLENDRTKPISSKMFNQRGQSRLYFLRDGATNYYIDSLSLSYLSVTSGSFSLEQYNSFIKNFNINLQTLDDADAFMTEFNQLFLQREVVLNKDDLRRRFMDDSGLIGSISTLKAIGQSSDGQGFDLLFYTVDEQRVYLNRMSLTKEALFDIYRVESLNLSLPHNSL